MESSSSSCLLCCCPIFSHSVCNGLQPAPQILMLSELTHAMCVFCGRRHWTYVHAARPDRPACMLAFNSQLQPRIGHCRLELGEAMPAGRPPQLFTAVEKHE